MLKKAEIFLRNDGKSDMAIEEIRGKALAMAEKFELEAAKRTSLLPGVTETLATLKKMGLKVGLFTINSEKSTIFILKRFRIAGLFDVVVPRNRVKYVKPSSEHLEFALKTLGVDPKETMVVGDGASDMKCARGLDAVIVGLPTGLSPVNELINSGANYIITSITDVPKLIQHIQRTYSS